MRLPAKVLHLKRAEATLDIGVLVIDVGEAKHQETPGGRGKSMTKTTGRAAPGPAG